jgi:hypothetical protein
VNNEQQVQLLLELSKAVATLPHMIGGLREDVQQNQKQMRIATQDIVRLETVVTSLSVQFEKFEGNLRDDNMGVKVALLEKSVKDHQNWIDRVGDLDMKMRQQMAATYTSIGGAIVTVITAAAALLVKFGG